MRIPEVAVARLSELAADSGMTHKRVAQAAGCPVAYLEDVLAGGREFIHPDVLRDLARVFHTYPGAILAGSLDDGPSLAGRIATLRRDRGFSQKTLAHRMQDINGIGVHYSQVRRWERATSHPNDVNLAVLAQALGVSTNHLRYGSETPPLPVRVRTVAQRRVVRVSLMATGGVALVALVFFAAGLIPHLNPGTSEAPQVRIGNEGHSLQVANPVTHELVWARNFEARVKDGWTTPWNGRDVLIAGLDGSATNEAGAFLVYDLASQDPIIQDLPDASARARYTALLGRSGVDMQMIWRRYSVTAKARSFADIDGDGRDELLVPFASNHRNGPSQFRVYDADGSRRGDFFVSGQIEYHLAADVDGDGRDEILLSTTSSSPAQRGFSLIMLDGDHMNGASPDARENPNCRLPEGALGGVTFPAFDDPVMQAIGSLRLMAWQTALLPAPDPDGARYLVWVGVDQETPLLLYLDENLQTVRATYSDVFAMDMNDWPSDVRDRFLGGYLDAWSQSGVRFGAFNAPAAIVPHPAAVTPADAAVAAGASDPGLGDVPRR